MNKADIEVKNLLDLSKTDYYFLFKNLNYPFELIKILKNRFMEAVDRLDFSEYNRIKDGVYVHKSVTVLKSVYLGRNIIIGKNADIRNSAFLRENVIIGDNCVVGNSCELKNVLMFNESKAPHFNYIGDSILGYRAHIGAGVVLSNQKIDKSNIVLKLDDGDIDTGLTKFGSILSDNVEVGCNSVLNPGTIICRDTDIYPLQSIRGVIGPNLIYKSNNMIVTKNIE